MLAKIMQSLREFWRTLARRSVIVPLIGAVTVVCMAVSVSSINTFIVHDDDKVMVHKSYTKDTMAVLDEMGIKLQELDAVTASQKMGSEDICEVYIQREGEAEIRVDGKTMKGPLKVGESVKAVLDRAGVKITAHDLVSPAVNQAVSDKMCITVTRVDVQQAVKTVRIPFNSVSMKSKTLDKGKTVVAQKGVPGQKQQVYEVVKSNGKVVRQKLLREVIISQPKNQIIERGVREKTRRGAISVSRGGGTLFRYKKVLDVTATAYSTERWTNKTTATGAIARVGLIAVDPRVIPLGSRLYITSDDGKRWIYGYAVAADTGGSIKGCRIDLFFDTHNECIQFGRRKAKVYVLE